MNHLNLQIEVSDIEVNEISFSFNYLFKSEIFPTIISSFTGQHPFTNKESQEALENQLARQGANQIAISLGMESILQDYSTLKVTENVVKEATERDTYMKENS